jgi:hypothetical protein
VNDSFLWNEVKFSRFLRFGRMTALGLQSVNTSDPVISKRDTTTFRLETIY